MTPLVADWWSSAGGIVLLTGVATAAPGVQQLLGQTTPIMSWRPHDVRRRTRLVVEFGPDGTHGAGSDLLKSMGLLENDAFAVCQLPRDDRWDPLWPDAAAGYDACLWRAEAALRTFETAFVGP